MRFLGRPRSRIWPGVRRRAFLSIPSQFDRSRPGGSPTHSGKPFETGLPLENPQRKAASTPVLAPQRGNLVNGLRRAEAGPARPDLHAERGTLTREIRQRAEESGLMISNQHLRPRRAQRVQGDGIRGSCSVTSMLSGLEWVLTQRRTRASQTQPSR